MEIEVGQLITKAKTKRCGDGEYPVLSMTMHDGLVFQNDRKKELEFLDELIKARFVNLTIFNYYLLLRTFNVFKYAFCSSVIL